MTPEEKDERLRTDPWFALGSCEAIAILLEADWGEEDNAKKRADLKTGLKTIAAAMEAGTIPPHVDGEGAKCEEAAA